MLITVRIDAVVKKKYVTGDAIKAVRLLEARRFPDIKAIPMETPRILLIHFIGFSSLSKEFDVPGRQLDSKRNRL